MDCPIFYPRVSWQCFYKMRTFTNPSTDCCIRIEDIETRYIHNKPIIDLSQKFPIVSQTLSDHLTTHQYRWRSILEDNICPSQVRKVPLYRWIAFQLGLLQMPPAIWDVRHFRSESRDRFPRETSSLKHTVRSCRVISYLIAILPLSKSVRTQHQQRENIQVSSRISNSQQHFEAETQPKKWSTAHTHNRLKSVLPC